MNFIDQGLFGRKFFWSLHQKQPDPAYLESVIICTHIDCPKPNG